LGNFILSFLSPVSLCYCFPYTGALFYLIYHIYSLFKPFHVTAGSTALGALPVCC